VSQYEVVPLFLALLAVLAQAAVLAVVLVALLSRRALRSVREALAGTGPPFALVVATIATGGSLWLSEVAGFVPCTLCWWQRGLMYPLVPILAAAWLSRVPVLRRIALVAAGAGAVIAAYHVALERWPQIEVTSCSSTSPCTARWVEELGYVTIPVMSLSAFLLVGALLLVDSRRSS
jgi:hypothetical protein